MSNPVSRIPSPGAQRIDRRFAALKAAGRTGLIPFVTAGDPSPEHAVALMHALVESGADLIELGVPFSDPMADGPVIQHASERAIAKGVGLAGVLGWVAGFRQRDKDTPVVLMGYLNPIEIHGYARFAAEAVQAGVDGVLLVDCPLEESAVLAPLREAGLRQILLAAPTTAPARLEKLCEAAEGFLYYVSFAGITGAARLSTTDIAARVADLRAHAKAPVAVGFGVRDAESAKAIAGFADAVVIGSALVERLAGAASAEEIAARVAAFLRPVREALDAR
ncbi:MAG: tryptophan synthase subunit alpha [Rhodanobacter sp. 68-29]|uniref:tryptophan synthase subunit alpha n=1 Tax=Rhodanobacter sp. PCA2 TaxID=2006117 RepID=UPI00086F7DEA|nr:tryptophan synthase subunit alpha [Rhodanobacter sp. PCA2]MBA2078176.1 tryptophan synthase subunit alpha [Rhodanobacter sp. PCA2]MBN8923247.1 tryptophan synthase subunit alpha [Rhodanobacter sp.]ODU73786.1 MAG: tryptophan synthase subunit alpha [Rhodanobacter sp. SCN 69-32]OJY59522.1 MAG: tryptophan synthase subunit alpha [Rhodanobacter sp. 68-29]